MNSVNPPYLEDGEMEGGMGSTEVDLELVHNKSNVRLKQKLLLSRLRWEAVQGYPVFFSLIISSMHIFHYTLNTVTGSDLAPPTLNAIFLASFSSRNSEYLLWLIGQWSTPLPKQGEFCILYLQTFPIFSFCPLPPLINGTMFSSLRQHYCFILLLLSSGCLLSRGVKS